MDESNSARHVLIIDDDLDDSEIFEEVLHQLDSRIHLTILYNCYDIINVLNELDSIPDVLFIDVNLHGVEGLKCIETIKTTTKYSNVKVVIYCGAISQHIIDHALKDSTYSYFLKPTSLKEIHDLLERILITRPLT
jgi:DNA-binding NtrC family response regulator